jgi:hypothetical protein
MLLLDFRNNKYETNKYENGEWRRTNREPEVLSKGENLVKWIKGQRTS